MRTKKTVHLIGAAPSGEEGPRAELAGFQVHLFQSRTPVGSLSCSGNIRQVLILRRESTSMMNYHISPH